MGKYYEITLTRASKLKQNLLLVRQQVVGKATWKEMVFCHFSTSPGKYGIAQNQSTTSKIHNSYF